MNHISPFDLFQLSLRFGLGMYSNAGHECNKNEDPVFIKLAEPTHSLRLTLKMVLCIREHAYNDYLGSRIV